MNSTTKLNPALPWPFELLKPMTEAEILAEILAEIEEAPL